MLSAHADVPLAVDVVEAEAHVKGVAAELRLGESWIAAVFQINLRTVKLLHNEAELQTCRNHTPEEAFAKGILGGKTLVGERAYLVVEHRGAHAMILPQKVEGQVRAHIERLGTALVAREAH